MRTRPPGPKGVPLFGSSRRYARDPFEFLTACGEAYGDVVRFDLGPVGTYMLTNPADVERVLVTDAASYRKPSFISAIGDLLGHGLLMSDGETWRRQRDLAGPAFRMQRIASLVDMMADRAASAVAEWGDGEVRDVHDEMARLTVRIVVEAMFGTSMSDERIRTVQENLEPLGRRFEPDPFRVVVPDWAPTRENVEYRRSIGVLEGIIDDMVEERRGTEYGRGAGGDARGGNEADPGGGASGVTGVGDPAATGDDEPMDLLSILLRARDRGEQTDRQLRDELMTMLLAGHDTTALALTYAWRLLADHPEAAARLRAEVDEVLGDRRPTMADLRELTYTERVLLESMRLYPPVYVMFREPKVDVKLGGYRVPADSAVMLPQWVIHRSPRYWDDPESFDPDRFSPERSADRPRYAYFPFGAGPRHCIGKQFSVAEAKVIVATVARAYDLDRAEDRPLRLRGSLTMHPRDPVRMRLRAR
ncbi:MAG: cytochrome P450 [Salinigranum sp.]